MRRGISVLLVVLMIVSSISALAANAEFTDWPDDWSSTALEAAVDNGLMSGSGGKIRAKDNLTRAELATIINNAFGAVDKADISNFTDVEVGAWFYDEIAKAVAMGTFTGSGDNKMRPRDQITREEALVVLARAFKLTAGSTAALNKFTDAGQVSSWAAAEVAALVAAGYVNGNGSQLNPKSNITRAEFAQVMFNIVKTYIRTAGTVTTVVPGNVVISVGGVTLENLTIQGDLIIADGVDMGTVTLNNVTITGRVVLRSDANVVVNNDGDDGIVSVLGVSLNVSSASVAVGSTRQLSATITPSNATNKAVTWSSSDTSIATVSDTGIVRAIKKGNATITVTTVDGAKTATCAVTVTESTGDDFIGGGGSRQVAVTSVTIAGDEYVTGVLSATVTPSNATSPTYQWYVSDTAPVADAGTEIAGATTASYTLTTAEQGKFVYVIVSGANSSEATSAKTAAIAAEPTPVTLSTVTADGSATATTTTLTLTFSEEITGLTAADITLGGTADVTKGTLTAGTPGTYTLTITVNAGGTVTVASVAKTGYKVTVTAPAATVYKVVTFTSALADGTAGAATTTKVTLTFSEDIAGLVAGDITVTGATKGALAKVAGTGVYELALTGITASGTIDVAVAKTGVTFNPASQSASVVFYTPPVVTVTRSTVLTDILFSIKIDGSAPVTGSTLYVFASNGCWYGLTVPNDGELNAGPLGALIPVGTRCILVTGAADATNKTAIFNHTDTNYDDGTYVPPVGVGVHVVNVT